MHKTKVVADEIMMDEALEKSMLAPSNQLTLEQKKLKVKDLRPIDDVFFEVLANDVAFCQEILRVILGDEKLIVIDVVVQSSKRNLYGRSVRLDALCTLGNGKKCNIEVQRSDNDNHLKRVRFNAANITVIDSQKGDKFSDVEDLYIVYISEFDVFRAGYTLYHVDNVIRETGDMVDDGLQRIFVNAEVNDGTDVAELMECFMSKEVNNPKFPNFKNRMHFLKGEERGLSSMCKVMERYEKLAAEIAAEEAAKSEAEKAIINMIEFGVSKEQILTAYTEEEYNEAMKQLKKKESGCKESKREEMEIFS